MSLPDIRNPYEHITGARRFESEGNMRSAEAEWKHAVIASDSLPMREYKRNYRQELVRYSFDPNYEAQPGVTKENLSDVYSQLLSLPFTTRMHLSSFYARHQAFPEARESCEQAFAFGMDPLAREHVAMQDFLKRAEIIRDTLLHAVGPDDLPQVFKENFENLDLDGDGFVHEKELRQAQFDLSLSPECQKVVRYLLENYAEVEAAHHDEWGLDIRGISRRDVIEHESQKNSNWKRMRKP